MESRGRGGGKCRPKGGKQVFERAGGPAVEIVTRDNVVAGFQHGHDGVDGRHATGEHARCRTAFERCEVSLQAVAGWIRYTRVFVTLILSDFFLNVSRGRVDGGGDGSSGGIGLLSHMGGAGGKT